MRVTITLDKDQSGKLSDLPATKGHHPVPQSLATVFHSVLVHHVRSKRGVVNNGIVLMPQAQLDEFGRRTIWVISRGATTPMAAIVICLQERTFSVKVSPAERKKAMQADLEFKITH